MNQLNQASKSFLLPDPAFAAFLQQHRQAITDAWVLELQRLAGGHYHALAPADLRSWTIDGLDAIGESLACGSFAPLDAYLSTSVVIRQRSGLTIDEVIEGLLLGKVAIQPLLPIAFASGTPLMAQALDLIELCLRYAAGRYSLLYADLVNSQLREQERRTALMLDATRAASSSLDLDLVLERIANGIAAATGVPDVGMYLLEHDQRTLTPHVVTQAAAPSLRKVFYSRPLDAQSEPAIRELFARRRPAIASNMPGDLPLDPALVGDVRLTTALGLPIIAADAILGMALVSHFDQHRPFSDEQIELAWGIAQAVALPIENARLYAETRQRLIESQSLQRVTSALLGKLGLPEIFDLVCSEARMLTQAPSCALLLLEDDGWLRVAYTSGAASPPYERLAVADSFAGGVLRSGVAQMRAGLGPAAGAAAADASAGALLVAPLKRQGTTIGTMSLFDKPGGFTDNDLRVIALLADQAAIAIEKARLDQQIEQLAVFAERQRLARDLHDSVAQSLYSLTLFGEAAAGAISDNDLASAAAHVQEVSAIARDALAEMRLLIFNLRSPQLETDGLVAALQARLDAVESRAALATELHVEGAEQLPLALKETLYRVAQEALNNVLKHARASRVCVRLQFGARTRLSIADDGVGFDPARGPGGGIGLRSMDERARQAGGRLHIRSALGQGTTVSIEVSA